jgi:hypothetical protein
LAGPAAEQVFSGRNLKAAEIDLQMARDALSRTDIDFGEAWLEALLLIERWCAEIVLVAEILMARGSLDEAGFNALLGVAQELA